MTDVTVLDYRPDPSLDAELAEVVRCAVAGWPDQQHITAELVRSMLRPVGLTSGQFSLLMALNRPQPPSLKPVAELLAMDRTTLTAALKPLERRGFVQIVPDAADRRSRLLVLTAAGRAVLAAASKRRS